MGSCLRDERRRGNGTAQVQRTRQRQASTLTATLPLPTPALAISIEFIEQAIERLQLILRGGTRRRAAPCIVFIAR